MTLLRAPARSSGVASKALVFGLLVAAGACRKPAPTQLVIHVESNFANADLQSFQIDAIREPASVEGYITQSVFFTQSSDTAIHFPTQAADLGIVSSDATDTRRVHVTVTITPDPSTPYVSFHTDALVSFTPNHATRVDVFLAKECADGSRAMQCESMGLTCGQGGQCVTILQDSLPELDSNGNLLDGSFDDLTVVDVPFVLRDAATETGVDAAVDAPPDATPDVVTDASVDSPTDVPTGAMPDSGPCAPGTAPFMGHCVAVPHGIRPLTGARVGTNTPTFGITLPGAFDGAQIQVCRDRACTMIVQTLVPAAHATTVAPTAPLPAGILFWRAVGTSGGVAASAPSTPWWIDVPEAAGADTVFGSFPDFDGDGIAEVVVGSPYANSGQGAVYIYHGPISTSPTAADVTLMGPGAANAHFGASVASAGDLDGDGYTDLAVGAPEDNGGAGIVYVYRGGPTGIHAPASATFNGSAIGATALAGSAVSAGGDITQDGLGDLLVGAPGHVVVVPGNATTTLAAALTPFITGPASFGEVLSGATDANGDGNPDFLVGAQTAPPDGDAFLYETPGGATLPTSPAFQASMGVGSSGGLGASVFGQGDINGDGRTDVVIGAPTAFGGRVYYWLSTAGAFSDPSGSVFDASGAGFGAGVALVRGSGSIFGDTLVIGDGDGGRVSFYETVMATMHPGTQTVIAAPTMAVQFGASVAPAGDVNGDGVDDLIVGAPNTDGQASAYVFFGHTTSPQFAATPDLTFGSGASLDGYAISVQ